MLQIVNSLRKCVIANLNNVKNISTHVDFKEVTIKVPWGHVAGKWWGPTDVRPVLSLHGWQDNCGTFDRLMPLLNKNVGFLCIDLPGHGYSSRLPQGMFYHVTNYLIMIHHIARYFQWPKVSLMGHSLGGITSYVYSMIYPQNMDFVICLDGAKPMIHNNINVYMAYTIENFFKYDQYCRSNTEPPSYPMEEVKRRVCRPNDNSIMMEHAHILLERNIAPSKQSPGKYYFTRDPRLKSGGFLNFSQDELIEYAQYMEHPIFIAKAKGGSYYEAKENFYEVLEVLKRSSVDCDFHYVEGSHHVHFNNPERVAPLINQFIQRHNIEDRSVGGIKDEMIVDKAVPVKF
ncbi:hypothetical protein NQ315_011983 [Exocentrus adspersus]|uniref:AB hydrolase-1 domain-containing protein n=1 Tax=Exocentrus adspersus TaxID=1586481 RepID=A0AAV8W324_9CUCU|nr:hypothetical protein NQ315_011983 [Exocentrus adspersus]